MRATDPVILALDVAVGEYAEWQVSRPSNETFENNINKARTIP